jgi:hypothetical protein
MLSRFARAVFATSFSAVSARAGPRANRTDFGRFDLNETSNVPLTKDPEPDDSTLIRYLVGRASEDETEHLDELSVVDEDFAQRLRAVEHDLLDAYANGELTGDALEGFRSQYLRSPAGLLQVEFAEALRGHRRAAIVDQASPSAALARIWSIPRWQLAAAVVLLAASGYLLADDLRIRRQMSAVRETHAGLEQRARQLQEDVNRQQAATRATEEELARAREALAAVPSPANVEPRSGGQGLLAFMLHAATRDAGKIPELVIPKGGDTVILLLPLVAIDFPHYEAVLKEATSDRVIWRSGRLGAPAPSDRPMIPLPVRTSVLAPRAYTLELTGISARGAIEPLDTYPFRVVP